MDKNNWYFLGLLSFLVIYLVVSLTKKPDRNPAGGSCPNCGTVTVDYLEANSMDKSQDIKTETAIFAAGCFWGVESAFRKVKGVVKTTVGYTGGHTKNPTYKDVCTDKTGHAETIQIEFDPKQVSYNELLDVFWSIHNPTTLNRQGPDFGSQYRSAIFYADEKQRKLAEESKNILETAGKFRGKIVTEITKAGVFYPAEEYHQNYFEKNNIIGSCAVPVK